MENNDTFEVIQRIPLDKLRPYPDHPFGVRDDDMMRQTVESIKQFGVLVPGIARPLPDGSFELIAGHRRKQASAIAGLTDMPIIVRDIDRNAATIARLSDLICTEHQLSVITNPQRGSTAYNKWHGFKGTPSHREVLRIAIDEALEQRPHDFNAFLSLLAEQGFKVKNGKHLTFVHADFKQNIRMYTLGDEYSEEAIRAIIKGQRVHQPKKRRAVWDKNRPQSIIDIQAKLAAGMGEGYRRWATVENLKRMAKTKLYMDEHGFSYEAMADHKAELSAKEKELSAKIAEAQNRLAEINVLKTHIVNYSKTRDVYVAYRKSGYSKKFLEEHEADIIIHKAAKKAFDEMGVKKLPTVKSLQVEFADLLTAKKEAYAELKKVRDELRDITVHTANYEELRDLEEREKRKEKEHGRE